MAGSADPFDRADPHKNTTDPHHPGHHDAPVLHRLPQPFDRVAADSVTSSKNRTP